MQLSSELSAEHVPRGGPTLTRKASGRATAWLHAVAGASEPAARRKAILLVILLTVVLCGGVSACFLASRAGASPAADERSKYWEAMSRLDLKNLVTIGKNPYFNLDPGYRLRYTNGEQTRTVTVRRKTKVVEGIETRVIEEKEELHGQATRIIWRYYAIDKTTSALYCFGSHTQTYYQGRLLGHRGWRSGKNGAMFTLVLPAAPQAGDVLLRNHTSDIPRRQEEVVIDTAAEVVTPAGNFSQCVSTETRGRKENKVKVFAPGVGLVQDGPFVLVKVVETAPRKNAKADVK